MNAANLRNITQAHSLERITLAEMEISDDEIAVLVEADLFHMVNLSETNLLEAQLETLCQCRRLELLLIRETDVPASAIEILEASQFLKRVCVEGTALDTGFYEKRLSNGCVLLGSGKKPK